MDATRARPRFGPDHVTAHLQWATAAALAAAAILVTSLVVRELRSAPPFDPIPDATASAEVPPDAVSVPTLSLAAGHLLRIGESRDEAIAQLGPMKLLKRTEERGPLGLRETRSYQGVTLVFEPFERAGGARVAAIYLQ